MEPNKQIYVLDYTLHFTNGSASRQFGFSSEEDFSSLKSKFKDALSNKITYKNEKCSNGYASRLNLSNVFKFDYPLMLESYNDEKPTKITLVDFFKPADFNNINAGTNQCKLNNTEEAETLNNTIYETLLENNINDLNANSQVDNNLENNFDTRLANALGDVFFLEDNDLKKFVMDNVETKLKENTIVAGELTTVEILNEDTVINGMETAAEVTHVSAGNEMIPEEVQLTPIVAGVEELKNNEVTNIDLLSGDVLDDEMSNTYLPVNVKGLVLENNCKKKPMHVDWNSENIDLVKEELGKYIFKNFINNDLKNKIEKNLNL